MSEEDKKIKYKVLKVEDLLKEEERETKETEISKEEVQIPKITKIKEKKEEPKKEGTFQSEPKIEYRIEVEKPKTPSPLYPEPKKEIPKKKLKLPKIQLYIPIILLGVLGGAIFLFFFLKQMPKVPEAPEVVKEEPQETETVTILIPTITTPTQILTQTTTQTQATTQEFVFPDISQPPPFLPPQEAFGGLPIFKVYPSKEIVLKNLDEFEKALKNFLSKQEKADTVYLLNFIYDQKLIPIDTILRYFIINEEIKPIIKNYAFLLYYSYTRKNPILVFEVNDPEKAKSINQRWEKKMQEDLQTLFLETNPGKPLTKNFQTKTFQNFSYRILDFPYGYAIIWGIKDNYLIYSSNETSFQKIIPLLR